MIYSPKRENRVYGDIAFLPLLPIVPLVSESSQKMETQEILSQHHLSAPFPVLCHGNVRKDCQKCRHQLNGNQSDRRLHVAFVTTD